jgi:hypothetical protein
MARSRHLAAVWSLSVAAAIAAGGAGSDKLSDRHQVARAPANAQSKDSPLRPATPRESAIAVLASLDPQRPEAR